MPSQDNIFQALLGALGRIGSRGISNIQEGSQFVQDAFSENTPEIRAQNREIAAQLLGPAVKSSEDFLRQNISNQANTILSRIPGSPQLSVPPSVSSVPSPQFIPQAQAQQASQEQQQRAQSTEQQSVGNLQEQSIVAKQREAFVREAARQEEEAAERRGKFLELALNLGIPVGAAIAGTVNPNLLPQAAGLSTGFVEGQEKQRERQQELAIATEKTKEAERKEKKRDRKEAKRSAIELLKIARKEFPQGNVSLIKQELDRMIEEEFGEGGGTGSEQAFDKGKEKRKESEDFSKSQREDIEANMKLFPDRSREEIIQAMKRKGQL